MSPGGCPRVGARQADAVIGDHELGRLAVLVDPQAEFDAGCARVLGGVRDAFAGGAQQLAGRLRRDRVVKAGSQVEEHVQRPLPMDVPHQPRELHGERDGRGLQHEDRVPQRGLRLADEPAHPSDVGRRRGERELGGEKELRDVVVQVVGDALPFPVLHELLLLVPHAAECLGLAYHPSQLRQELRFGVPERTRGPGRLQRHRMPLLGAAGQHDGARGRSAGSASAP